LRLETGGGTGEQQGRENQRVSAHGWKIVRANLTRSLHAGVTRLLPHRRRTGSEKGAASTAEGKPGGRTSTRLAPAPALTLVGTLLLLTPIRSVSSQSASGAISGRVIDSAGVSLYAANVRIVGTAFNAATEQSGAFRFSGIPAGSYVVRVTALGYAPESSQVTVEGNHTATVAARLHPAAVLLSPVAINAQRMGETKRAALNHQQTAANILTVLSGDEIRALPNANAAEAAGRIPGVAIERDEGEGKFVQIRGTEPRLSNVTIDGSHVPGTERGD